MPAQNIDEQPFHYNTGENPQFYGRILSKIQSEGVTLDDQCEREDVHKQFATGIKLIDINSGAGSDPSSIANITGVVPQLSQSEKDTFMMALDYIGHTIAFHIKNGSAEATANVTVKFAVSIGTQSTLCFLVYAGW